MLSKPANSERVYRILDLLQRRTTATFSQLAEEFQVSEMTIRRDFDALDSTGQVLRIPGGVRLARGILAERTFLERLQRNAEAKSKIGRLAASLVADNESLVLDSGTTTLHIARHLKQRRCTVITFSVAAMEELSQSPTVRVELTGGVFRASSNDLIGGAVTATLASIRADKVFFGAAALSSKVGVMVNDAEAPRCLPQCGRQRILVIDSTKLETEALYRFCGLDQCDLLITDAEAKPEVIDDLRQLVEVRTAE
jgi:DeoR/GlpR family transcriptional regulator of sugar metabolism